MKGQKIKELIPLVLVVSGLLYTAIVVLTSDTILTHQHWIAYALTCIGLLTYFVNTKISNVMLGITLVLGVLNIVAFTPTIVTIGGGVRFNALDAEVMIGVQLFSLLTILTFVYAHRNALSEQIKKTLAWINKDGL